MKTATAMPFLGTHNGAFTLVSPKTGEHRTFKAQTLRKGNLEGKRVLSLLVGADNENDYNAFAFIDDRGVVTTWKKYRGTQYERFADLFNRVDYWAMRGIEYMAESRCRRCNRRLTHPESIVSGIGPECAQRS